MSSSFENNGVNKYKCNRIIFYVNETNNNYKTKYNKYTL